MKYWIEGRSENGHGKKGILIIGGELRLLSVVKTKEGIQFMEECDGYFSETYTKEDALKLIDELQEWINNKEVKSGTVILKGINPNSRVCIFEYNSNEVLINRIHSDGDFEFLPQGHVGQKLIIRIRNILYKPVELIHNIVPEKKFIIHISQTPDY